MDCFCGYCCGFACLSSHAGDYAFGCVVEHLFLVGEWFEVDDGFSEELWVFFELFECGLHLFLFS